MAQWLNLGASKQSFGFKSNGVQMKAQPFSTKLDLGVATAHQV
jgi:hypothetical protein